MVFSNLRHTPLPVSSCAVPVWARNVFKRLGKCRETYCTDLEIRSSMQTWSSNIWESWQFLIDRSLKSHSLLMPFTHWRNIAFPAFCVLRVIHCLKTLAWKSFFSSNFIWRCDCREGLQSHRERQTSIQTSLPSHFLCSRDLENIGLSGKFLDTVGTHPECEPGYQRWQNSHFTLGWPYNGVA